MRLNLFNNEFPSICKNIKIIVKCLLLINFILLLFIFCYFILLSSRCQNIKIIVKCLLLMNFILLFAEISDIDLNQEKQFTGLKFIYKNRNQSSYQSYQKVMVTFLDLRRHSKLPTLKRLDCLDMSLYNRIGCCFDRFPVHFYCSYFHFMFFRQCYRNTIDVKILWWIGVG